MEINHYECNNVRFIGTFTSEIILDPCPRSQRGTRGVLPQPQAAFVLCLPFLLSEYLTEHIVIFSTKSLYYLSPENKPCPLNSRACIFIIPIINSLAYGYHFGSISCVYESWWIMNRIIGSVFCKPHSFFSCPYARLLVVVSKYSGEGQLRSINCRMTCVYLPSIFFKVCIIQANSPGKCFGWYFQVDILERLTSILGNKVVLWADEVYIVLVDTW